MKRVFQRGSEEDREEGKGMEGGERRVDTGTGG